MQNKRNAEIAKTIMNQIGTPALVMIGASGTFAIENGARILHSCQGSKTNLIEVVLNGSDLYDMKFYKKRGGNVKEVGSVENVYSDKLKSMISEYSGLRTSL